MPKNYLLIYNYSDLKEINIETWNRRQHFHHFKNLRNPYFAVTVPVDVTKAYITSKSKKLSFFVKYLHDCMKAINAIENMRYRIIDNKVFDVEIVHASATIMREDKTFGFSWIEYSEDLFIFNNNFQKEKSRIQENHELYPQTNGENCIHCSAMPWINFTSQKEPTSGNLESIPELSFSKVIVENNKSTMNVAISVNHALVDGYHVGLFLDLFQKYLDE